MSRLISSWQGSLPAKESAGKVSAKGLDVQYGDCAANPMSGEVDLLSLPVGTKLRIGAKNSAITVATYFILSAMVSCLGQCNSGECVLWARQQCGCTTQKDQGQNRAFMKKAKPLFAS